jgi:hypothetical protein
MKKLTALLLVVFLSAAAWSIASTFTKNDKLDPPADAIGHPNVGQPPTIYFDKLVDEFQNGGTITQFQIATLGGNWKLLRFGVQSGMKRTEIIPISLVSGYFRFNGPVWYTVCDRSAQDCGSSGVHFCRPNSQGTSCLCDAGNQTCNFGVDVSQIYDVEVLD